MKSQLIRCIIMSCIVMCYGYASAQVNNAQQKVIENTNKIGLLNLAESMRMTSALEKQLALQKAKEQGWKARVLMGDGKVAELIKLDEQGNPVYYITDNANAAISTNTVSVYPGGNLGLSLEGNGMTVGLWDAGAVRWSHQQLGARVSQVDFPFYYDHHATHTCGTMVGDGTPYAAAKGMAPRASVLAYEWNADGSEMAAAAANGLLVSNHSYGIASGWFYNGAWHWFGNADLDTAESHLFGWYESEARLWDNIAFNAPYYLIVKSAGNDRSDAGPAPGDAHSHSGSGSFTDIHPADGNGGTGYDCLPTKSVAKNIMTVGAVNDVVPGGYSGPGSVVMSSFSGWGPTDDGRIKPDIVGNGIGLVSSIASHDSSYSSFSGTSMSSPNIAGSCILLQEHYQNIHSGDYMRAATLKALVIHTADEAGPAAGPDYMFGWGLMNTGNAAALITSDGNLESHIQENTINSGTTFQHVVTVNGSQPLVATICWTDVPGAAESAGHDIPTLNLVNDLDLRISNGSATYQPYILDPANPSGAATTGDNFRDNVEKIFIAAPAAGTYTVTVSHKGSLMTGSQAFSLVISGITTPTCSDPHSLSVSQIDGSSSLVDWTPGNTSVSWSLEYGVKSFTPGTGITITGNYPGASSASLNNLVPSVDYDIYIKETCAGGQLTNRIGPFRFSLTNIIEGSHCENFDLFNNCGNNLFECVPSGGCDGAFTSPGWENGINDNNEWSVDDFDTPSENTGPQGDHTSGSGRYLFVEASNCFFNSAILLSPGYDLSTVSSPSLSFWYHMLGSAMGSLAVDIENPIGSGQWASIWSISGTQGQNWNNANINLAAYSGSIVRFRFTGTAGADFESDMAIDDVCISSLCVDASGCNDHNPCTTDNCISGICSNASLCIDSDPCTADICSNGTCQHLTIPNCSQCSNLLTTLMNGSTAQNGNMFDVTAKKTIKITSFDGNFSDTSDFEIYYKPGSHVGFESYSAAWNLLGSAAGVASNGANNITPIPIPINITIPAGETYSFYITATGSNIRYTFGTLVGATAAQDANLEIKEGTSNVYPFGTSFEPRIWNGRIHYECSDFDPCAVTQCINGVCSSSETVCPDDSDPCTVSLGCLNGQCVNTPLCDDHNPCTIDECDAISGCSYAAIPDCDPCSGINCNDHYLCTVDYCADALCYHTPVSCSDSDLCTNDGCNHAIGCVYTQMDCSDGNACTADSCSGGQCSHSPIDCGDNDLCTNDDCDTISGCVSSQMNCDDSDPCTDDGCSNGQCNHSTTSCNDSDACTTDSCIPGSGCSYSPMNCDDSNGCTSDMCDNGACRHNTCNDNNLCTKDTCLSGQCTFIPKTCNDNNLCTTDGCASGDCVFTPANCNDNNLCTTDECVRSTGACSFTPVNCNDNDVCSIDNCAGGQCVHSCDPNPNLQWQRSLGGTANEEAACIRQTSDGGYIVAGYTASNNGDVSGNHGSDDYWVAKLEATGAIVWQKVLGGSLSDRATSVRQTSDGGYVVAGYAQSTNGDVAGNHGSRDMWVVKLDANGNITWKKALGGSSTDEANDIQQTTDGGYIVAGLTYSNNGDVSGNHGMHDYWVVKLNSGGSITWQKTLGGTNIDIAYTVWQTTDFGYVVAGAASSTNGDVTGNHGTSDFWVVKLNNSGSLLWQKSLGGTSADKAHSIQQTTDGGFIVAGPSASYNGDVIGSHGSYDYWVVKLNSNGNMVWQKALGGSGADEAAAVRQTTDGGYIASGYSASNNGNASGTHGAQDFWTVKLDGSGNIEWQKMYGGTSNDKAASVSQTSDGAYVIAGSSQSNDGDASGNHGLLDYWVVKLGSCAEVTTVSAFSCVQSHPPVIDTLTGTNGCDSIVITQFTYNASCDDGNLCTEDRCINNICISTITGNCDDNDCNTADSYDSLTCQCTHALIPPPDCDDNDCNTTDTYNYSNCQCDHSLIPPPDCNDNDCNTADSYNTLTCQCQHVSIPPPDCDDNDCNTNDTYNPATCECINTQIPPPDCDDNNCGTADTYNTLTCQCEYAVIPPSDCDDNDCNTSDNYNVLTCQCEHAVIPPPNCDDNNCNTIDTYNALTCICEHTIISPNCDDNNCNTSDSYNSSTCQCAHTPIPPPDCNDNNCNTNDSYNSLTCQCEHTLIPPPDCNDNNCNTTDTYNSANCHCENVPVAPPNCDDNDCNTFDNYNSTTCQCEHAPIPPSNCNDNDCNTTDSYNSLTCQCIHTPITPPGCNDNDCNTSDTYNSLTCQCIHTPITHPDCNDNDCNTTDFYNSSTCQCIHTPITPLGCDDNDCNTTDSYNSSTCQCVHTPIPPPGCNDNDCNTTDSYNSSSCQCVHALITPASCNDNNCNTNDSYNSATCQCVNTPITPPDCNDNNCNTADSYNSLTCQCVNTPIAPPSCNDNDCGTDDSYNVQTCQCEHSPVNCNDNNCNTFDIFFTNNCQCLYFPITPPDCDDSDCSTSDIYNSQTCLCEHTLITQPDCDDNNCNTIDTYHDLTCECVHTLITPPNCDDGSCNTADTYNTLICQCEHLPVPPPNCDDNDCNTSDSYNAQNCQCEHAVIPPPDCNDNDCNTIDAYNSLNCTCKHTQVSPPDCNDSDCNTVDSYNYSNCQCVHSLIPPPDCNDNDCNTADSYNNLNCQCVHSLIPPPDCNDNDCNTTDTYNNSNCQCVHTLIPPPDCNDNDCNTADSYNNSNCQCVHTLIPPPNCDDNDCNTADSYNNSNCQCVHSLIPPPDCNDNDCNTVDSYNYSNCQCVHTLIPPPDCNDNDCNTADSYNYSNCQCVHTLIPPPDCNDNDCNTADSYNYSNCQCVHTLIPPPDCDDNDCNTVDSYNYSNCQCVHTLIPPPDCDDNDCNTADSYNYSNCQCVHTLIPPPDCDDNDCNTVDSYNNSNCQCIHTLIPPPDCNDNDCNTADSYNYSNCQCVHTLIPPPDCDDNDCNTADSYNNSNCQCVHTLIPPPDCDDNDCNTADSYNYSNCQCVHTLIPPPDCNDNNCNTADSYNYSTCQCVHSPVACTPDDACHVAECINGVCAQTPVVCEPVSVCSQALCDPELGCIEAGDTCDDNNPCTEDICEENNCVYIPESAAIFSSQTAFCQGTTTASLTAVFPSAVSYLWSTGATTMKITGTAGNSYSVTVTASNGCTGSAAYNVVYHDLASSYVAIATESITLTRNTVFNGGIGVTSSTGVISLNNITQITSPMTFARASAIQVNGGSTVTTQMLSPAPVTLPPFEANPYAPGTDLNIAPGARVTLTDSIFGSITIGKLALVTFTAKNIHATSITTRDKALLRFNSPCTRIRLSDKITLGLQTNFNFTSSDVIVFVENEALMAPSVTVKMDLYVHSGNLTVQPGTSLRPNRMTGLFIAEQIMAGDYTYWYWNTACSAACSGGVASKLVPETDNKLKSAHHITAYPNPFSDRLHIEFALAEDSRVRLEIISATGQRLAVLFEGDVKAAELYIAGFTAATISGGGIIIYRLQTEKESFYGKAVMVK